MEPKEYLPMTIPVVGLLLPSESCRRGRGLWIVEAYLLGFGTS
jgi:hypothetical protein